MPSEQKVTAKRKAASKSAPDPETLAKNPTKEPKGKSPSPAAALSSPLGSLFDSPPKDESPLRTSPAPYDDVNGDANDHLFVDANGDRDSHLKYFTANKAKGQRLKKAKQHVRNTQNALEEGRKVARKIKEEEDDVLRKPKDRSKRQLDTDKEVEERLEREDRAERDGRRKRKRRR